MNALKIMAMCGVIALLAMGGCADEKNEEGTRKEIPLPTASISADPLSVEYGGNSTVSWECGNTESALVMDNTGNEVSTNLVGSFLANSMTTSATYTAMCVGLDSITTASDSVTIVVAPELIPSVTLTANPSSVTYNASSTLSWNSVNVASCSLKDEGGSEVATGVSGSYTTSALTANATYSISCTGNNGDASDSVTVVTSRVEIEIGTANELADWDSAIRGIYPLIVLRFWPQDHPISYYAETGISVTITKETLTDSFIAYPEISCQCVHHANFFNREWRANGRRLDSFAGDYQITVSFEGEAVRRTVNLPYLLSAPQALRIEEFSVSGRHADIGSAEVVWEFWSDKFARYFAVLSRGNTLTLGSAYNNTRYRSITVPFDRDLVNWLDGVVLLKMTLYGYNWNLNPISPIPLHPQMAMTSKTGYF